MLALSVLGMTEIADDLDDYVSGALIPRLVGDASRDNAK
jgi:hypothetical protein